MGNLLTDVEIRRVSNAVAAASTGTTKATIIDMDGFDEVTFILLLGTVTNTAKVTFQIAQDDVNSTAGMAVTDATSGEIVSDGTTIALSNKAIALTINRPKERYLEAQVVKSTANIVIDGIIAILSKARTRPTANGSTVYMSKLFTSPANA